MAKHEAKASFMGAERYHALVAEATAYLQAERDLRGYDRNLHWIHAAAHTADLLAALADNPQLTSQEANGILQAIQSRLATAIEVFTQGEQDRLAIAVVSVIRRKDFETSTFAQWLTQLQEQDRDVWTSTTPESLARYQNHNYLLQALAVRTLMEPESARMADYRQHVIQALSRR
jgi:ABC-type Fe3+ transport system substrate-binding protein